MRAAELDTYERAIHEQICLTCPKTLPDGTCPRPDQRQCALSMHLEPVVDSILGLEQSAAAEDYRRAFEDHLCEICPVDETGYCSLIELIGSATDDDVGRLAYVIRNVSTTHG